MADFMSVKDRILDFCRVEGIRPGRFERESGLSNGYLSKLRHEPSRDKLEAILRAYPRLNATWLLTGSGEMLHACPASSQANAYPPYIATQEEIYDATSFHDVCTESHANTSPTAVYTTTAAISKGRVIPYFDAAVAAGTSYAMEMTQTQPSGMIEIGGLMKDSEFALRVYGNSMTPSYPAGCVVGLKQHTESFIEPGTVYVVETTENRYLKRLYYNKERSAFRCLSDNHMKHENGPMEGEYFYPEFEIPFDDVRRLLRVTGVIKRNIL